MLAKTRRQRRRRCDVDVNRSREVFGVKKWVIRLVTMSVLPALLLASLGTSTASAQQGGGLGAATLTVEPTAGTPGARLSISGTGYLPNSALVVRWDDRTVVVQDRASATGTFARQFTIPANATVGDHTVQTFAGAQISPKVTVKVLQTNSQGQATVPPNVGAIISGPGGTSVTLPPNS